MTPMARRVIDAEETRFLLLARSREGEGAKAASPHGNQSTGLLAGCSRYGDFSWAGALAMEPVNWNWAIVQRLERDGLLVQPDRPRRGRRGSSQIVATTKQF